MPSRLRLAALVAATLAAGGCAGKPAPRSAPPAGSAASVPAAAPAPRLSPRELRDALARTFDTPKVNALWAVKVQALDSGIVLFERNPHLLVMPASNLKIVTMAVAAERLGWDARFTTRIETTGAIEGGVLRGDLVVAGGGDPTIGERENAPRVLDDWAKRLVSGGITRIEGRIIGDDNAWADQALGEGWAWDDLAFGYAAAGGALQYNEDTARVIVEPGPEPGTPARVSIEPASADLEIVAAVTTTAAEQAAAVAISRRPFDRRLTVTGTVPQAGRSYTRTVAIDNPTRVFVTALRDALVRQNVAVNGLALDIDDLPASTPLSNDRRLLFAHESPPLSEIGVRFMKVSQNLIGETLLRRIGLEVPPAPSGAGTPPAQATIDPVEAGRRAYETTLNAWGIPSDAIVVSDGSGLSRYNFVTVDALTAVLVRMARDTKHAAPFEATLPIMGRDGTLERRMRGTRAEGVVRAKTGSLANVRALSGYLTTVSGERLVFSIVANNFKAPSAVVEGVADSAVELLLSLDSRRR